MTPSIEASEAGEPMSPVMAHSRHHASLHGCPLPGVKQTSLSSWDMSAFDPERTGGAIDSQYGRHIQSSRSGSAKNGEIPDERRRSGNRCTYRGHAGADP